MTGNGIKVKKKEEDDRFGLMEHSMRGNDMMTYQMVKEG